MGPEYTAPALARATKAELQPRPENWEPRLKTPLSRLSNYTAVLTAVGVIAVLILWPDLLIPSDTGPDAGSWILTTRWVTVPLVAVYVGLSFALDHPIAGPLPLHVVTLVNAALWPLAYWDITTASERWFFLSIVALWAAWAVALTYAHEMRHRRWAGEPLGSVPEQ